MCSLCDFTGRVPLWLLAAVLEENRLHDEHGWFRGTPMPKDGDALPTV